nr:putative ribonuclease H-like domain-containing protein [Tanacetum cinerariifolium]
IEAIRLFSSVPNGCQKCIFYGTIEEEVYICQPPGFENPKNPDKVYKVVKALYGLHQAPRAWYETLATYLLENRFQRGTIDQTLFIKKQQKDILLGRGLQVSQETEDTHMILTLTQFDAQQESSLTSSFMNNLLNPITDPGLELLFTTGSTTVTPIPSPKSPTPPTQIPSLDLQSLPTFALVFFFEDSVKSLEDNFSNIPGIVNQYMNQQMPEAVREVMQTKTNQLQDFIQRENDEFLKTINENMKKIIKEQVKSQVKAQVTRILPRIEEAVNAQLEAEVLTRSSHSSRTSYAVAANLSEMELKKILIENMERNKRREGGEHTSASTPTEPATESAGRSTTGSQSRQLSASESGFAEEPPRRPPTPDRDWNKSVPAAQREAQSWISALTKHTDARSSFNELLDTPIDLSNFIMNRLGVDTLTPELLAGPTYELMRGSCNSLKKLEYHLEEVYKATTDQLDWVNPEGQQYPHNLLQPLSLIPNHRGRSVIPFEHFINNDLEYLRGGALSRKYTTSITKTKAADYGHIKWIEDLVPRAMWIQEPISYDKHALWGVSHGGETSAVLWIVEWHNYKHLDWISVRRDDDKIYKFKEGDLKRLRIQDIEDMLLLFVQGKLSNLTIEERFAFNVSLRMFTRSIVIQRHVEDLQLGVESYQKRLNLTRPDTYPSDLKQREAYTAYSNPRGFIYQNKDKKNRLMRIDELYKFNDGTLNDVRNALDDRLKGIWMQYLPTTIWSRGDKARAAAMIQAIDKMLKTRRIMRSLERFICG